MPIRVSTSFLLLTATITTSYFNIGQQNIKPNRGGGDRKEQQIAFKKLWDNFWYTKTTLLNKIDGMPRRPIIGVFASRFICKF